MTLHLRVPLMKSKMARLSRLKMLDCLTADKIESAFNGNYNEYVYISAHADAHGLVYESDSPLSGPPRAT